MKNNLKNDIHASLLKKETICYYYCKYAYLLPFIAFLKKKKKKKAGNFNIFNTYICMILHINNEQLQIADEFRGPYVTINFTASCTHSRVDALHAIINSLFHLNSVIILAKSFDKHPKLNIFFLMKYWNDL